MDTNNFKKSQNFDNLESNQAHNANLDANHNQMAKDYISEMRSQKQQATREGFMNKAKNDCPPEAWANQEKAYNDAWEANKNSNLEE